MKKILTIITIVLMSSFTFSQERVISGKVTDENNVTLPGVSIIVKGANSGTSSDMDGEYTIRLKNNDAVLVFSYLGYKTVESQTKGKGVINVQMKEDAESLDEVVITTGIRASQRSAIEAKRDATLVIEAITPEDIGNFSDSNVADALQRIAGVQIERNVDDVAGDRVSIRGIGPQFVSVTMNGRSPISAGNEGKSDYRKFNLNVIPSEIISGARIKKTTQAKETTTNIGGTVDFLTIKPLEMRYKGGKDYVASVNVRSQLNSEFNDIDPFDFSGRFSGVYATKINEKLGFAISAIYADEDRIKDETRFTGLNSRNFNVDTNGNGTFDAGGDTTYENILTPNAINNVLTRSNEKRLTGSAAIQWRPTETVDFVLDYTRTNVDSRSKRQQLQLGGFASGGANNGLVGGNHLFAPEDLIIEGGNLLFISPSSNDVTRTNINKKLQLYDNYTTNNILGLRTTITPSEKLSIIVDGSYSDLDFKQTLTQVTGRIDGKRGNATTGYDQTEFSIDTRGGIPSFELPRDFLDSQSYSLNQVANRLINTKGYNYATTIDIAYDLSEVATITFGGRHAKTDFEARQTESDRTSDPQFTYGAITDAQNTAFQNLLTNTAGAGFNGGNFGGLENGWLYVPGEEVLDFFPGFASLDGGSVFDFDVALEDVVSDDGNLMFDPSRSYGAEETSTDFYTQLDWKTAIFQIPVDLNFGIRAIRTENKSEGFSALRVDDADVDTNDPDTDSSFLQAAIYHEVASSRWDVLPSFNSNFTLRKNLKLRLNVSRGASRPKYRDLIPNNTIRYTVDLPAGTDLASPEARGRIVSGNPDLKPYTAWMYDATVEGYTKGGGAFVFSAFYKDISNYIARSVLVAQEFPGEEILGIALPSGSENLLFDITKPVNLADAQLYGIEVGITQPFTFLPGFAKGFGIKANYSFVESNFDGDGIIGDAINGFPGTSKHSANGTFYYEQKAFSLRFTAAYRGDYLSNLGGLGGTRADQGHYTEGTTVLGFTGRYNMLKKKLQISAGVNNFTGEDVRRYQGDDKQSFSAYYNRLPIWKFGLRYKF
jgi:TonB-dependent receptor